MALLDRARPELDDLLQNELVVDRGHLALLSYDLDFQVQVVSGQ